MTRKTRISLAFICKYPQTHRRCLAHRRVSTSRRYIPGVRASWARGTWRCSSRRPSSFSERENCDMPRRKHDAAFAFRRSLSSCFSFSPSPSPSFSLHSLPRFRASRGNENPENVACRASVSADARDSRSFEARVIPFSPSLSSSRLLLSFSLFLHEFVQSGSLIPWIWFLLLLERQMRETTRNVD